MLASCPFSLIIDYVVKENLGSHEHGSKDCSNSSGGSGNSAGNSTVVVVVIIMVVVTVAVIIVTVVMVMIVADKLVFSCVGVVTDLCGTRAFQVVKTFFGSSTQDIVVAGVVDDAKGEEQVTASVGRAVNVTSIFNEVGVGVVSTGILAVGSRTVGGTLNEGSCDSTVSADLVKVMESVFDELGDTFFGTEIVVGLDDVEVLLALFGRAVGSARVGVQEGQSINHGVGVSTIESVTEFFCLAGTRASGCRSIAEKSKEQEKGRKLHHFADLVLIFDRKKIVRQLLNFAFDFLLLARVEEVAKSTCIFISLIFCVRVVSNGVS